MSRDSFFGLDRRFFSPVVIVAYVCVVGLGLFGRGFPEVQLFGS